MNKKWIYGIGAALVVVVAIALIAGACFHHRFDGRFSDRNASLASPVLSDLMYVGTSPDLKLTPEQAKAILPLVEKLNKLSATKVTDETKEEANQKAIADLNKQIYAQLTVQQYQALNSKDKIAANGNMPPQFLGKVKMDKRGHGEEREFRGKDEFSGCGNMCGYGQGSARTQAMPDIVIKMLKDISAGKVVAPAPSPSAAVPAPAPNAAAPAPKNTPVQ
ncbi:MAG: hypothetical protein ACM3UZ_03660 [Acidobacteriota bacterium]